MYSKKSPKSIFPQFLINDNSFVRRESFAVSPEFVSELTYDSRVTLTGFDIKLLLQTIRTRIFFDGKNAAGGQMERAKTPKSKLYRYDTGALFRSLRVWTPSRGRLLMGWDYPPDILHYLENRYGKIFAWSDYEIDVVNRLIFGHLREMNLDENASHKQAQKEHRTREKINEKITRSESAAKLEERNKKRRQERAEGRAKKEAPRIDFPYAEERSTVIVSSTKLLTSSELQIVDNKIIKRILSNKNYNGTTIPKDLRENLNALTLASIRLYQPSPGIVRVLIRLRNSKLIGDRRVMDIIKLSNSELQTLKRIFESKYEDKKNVLVINS